MLLASLVAEKEIKMLGRKGQRNPPYASLSVCSTPPEPGRGLRCSLYLSSASPINVKLGVEMPQKHLADMIILRACHLVCENSYM